LTPSDPPHSKAAGSGWSVVTLDANFTWTRGLFGAMANRAPTLFMEPKDWVTAYQSRWQPSSLFRTTNIAPGLWRKRYPLPPGWFSHCRMPFLRLLGWEASRWRGRTRASKSIVAITYPQYVDALRPADADVSIYYWSDHFQSYWPEKSDWITRIEQQAVSESNLTICISQVKADDLRKENPASAGKIHFVMHGFNSQLLPERPLPLPAQLPDDLAHLPRPVLGHWGQVSDYLDFEIVLRLADRFREGSIVFVGPISDNFRGRNREHFDACRLKRNVHFVGSRRYADARKYVPSFDVCLVLYRPDLPFTRVTNPSKIRDYIASTRPVVSTPLPDARTFYSAIIEVADDVDDYVGRVAGIVANGGDEREGVRFEFARSNGWAESADAVWSLIESADRARK